MPQLGAIEGFETGIDISVRLLVELGLQNKFITGEDISFGENPAIEADVPREITGDPESKG